MEQKYLPYTVTTASYKLNGGDYESLSEGDKFRMTPYNLS